VKVILLYAGSGLLIVHGLLHVGLLRVAFAEIGPEGDAKESLTSHWIGFSLYEVLIGMMILLSPEIAPDARENHVPFLSRVAAIDGRSILPQGTGRIRWLHSLWL